MPVHGEGAGEEKRLTEAVSEFCLEELSVRGQRAEDCPQCPAGYNK